MIIYLASSWRNGHYLSVLQALRDGGHEVYDFRNPAPGNNGFGWSQIDPNWKDWTPEQYREALDHPIAKRGFRFDMEALQSCDACVLVLPCGRSAHLELGYAVGAGKPTFILQLEPQEPELMAKMCTGIALSVPELLIKLSDVFSCGDTCVCDPEPCVRPMRHQGSHRDKKGNTWANR